MRKYLIPDVIIGGDKDCKHNFEVYNFKQHNGRGDAQKSGKFSEQEHTGACVYCSAWKGQHGLEPDYHQYLSNAKLWMQEAIRVVRDDGVIMINIADSYASSSIENVQSYGISDTIPQDCPLHDSPLNRPCDGCQAVSVLRSFHKDRSVSVVSSSDLHDPNPEHMVSESDHVPTSDSLNQKQIRQSSSATQDLQHCKDLSSEQLLSSQVSKQGESCLQSQGDNLQKDNVSFSLSGEQTSLISIHQNEHKKASPSLQDLTSSENQDVSENILNTSLIGGASVSHKKGKVYAGCPYQYSNITSHHLSSIKPKSKLLIPERFSIMCVDELGLILRNHIVWAKVNAMPESVRDRFSKKWESIFMFVKQPKYYFNLDAVMEKQQTMEIENRPHGIERNRLYNYQGKYTQISKQEGNKQIEDSKEFKVNRPYKERMLKIEGKNPGDVWNIPTQPSPEKHFAMWPEKLVERMILCSTKAGDTVCDCFCGSGTTGRIAIKYQRKFIGIDLGYKDIQERRLKNIQINMLT